MSNGDTEKQSYRDTDGTQETQDVPPLAASVKTLPEAVQLSLKTGLTKNSLFLFSRALRAFETTNQRRLPPKEVEVAFSLWWSTAKPLLPPDADFDEWRFVFLDTFEKTKVALGANPLDEAIRRADSNPPPPQAARYTSPGIKRLISVCYHLGSLAGDGTFFLSVRDSAQIFGTKSLPEASAMLVGLVWDGVLDIVTPGKPGGKKATRFRFNFAASGTP
jgi:hypothetical protein